MASGSVSQIAELHHLQMNPDLGVSGFVGEFLGETTVIVSNQKPLAGLRFDPRRRL
jgi:hypothetical protein